ncbi:hypothetical protein SEA_ROSAASANTEWAA_5 [Streptomyces phage RosaAsantewaa]|nr:hypothetical protein SEA_ROSAASANTEWAA_5 [Streptomyces phage RosaAsantewaa]
MSTSILTGIKRVLGISEVDDSFDADVMMHVNSAFATLNQIGIGPPAGFMIEDEVPTWDDFLGTDPRLNSAKSYVYLKTRLLFDPPQNSFVTQSLEKQAEEFLWRLNVVREGDSWTDPNVPAA